MKCKNVISVLLCWDLPDALMLGWSCLKTMKCKNVFNVVLWWDLTCPSTSLRGKFMCVCVCDINFVMVPCRYLRGKVLYFFPLLVGMGLEKVEWGGEGRGGESGGLVGLIS